MAACVRSPFPAREPAPDPRLSVSGFVFSGAARHSNRTALIDAASGRRLSYEALVSGVRRLASGLYRRFRRYDAPPSGGVVRRPVVCLYASNCLQYPVAFHAALCAGATVTTADPHLSADELSERFQLLMPDFVIADHDKVDDARFAASRVGTIKEFFVLGNHIRGHVSIDELLRDDGRAPLNDLDIDCKNDVAIVPFDVDSHGEPVGILHSHHTFNSTVSILGCPSVAPVSRDDVMVCCHQMASMVGLSLYCGAALREGATCVILQEMTHRTMLGAITRFKASVLHMTPRAAEFLASDASVARADISGVRRMYCSGAPLRAGLIDDLMARCGVGEVREGFATSGAAAILSVARGETQPGYVGKVVPHTEVKICDILFGGVMELDTFGELCVRGPQVMLGQLCKCEPEVDPLEDGWLHTGQIGQVDECGSFNLMGKIDNLIDYNQFQISPVELEHVVMQHPDVDDVVVVGMDNHGAGHVPRAYVMKRSGADVVDADIRDFVADQVPNHKQLRGGVIFVNDVPRAATGEPLRHQLQVEANRPRDLEISLGEYAQWPPDATYLADMRELQRDVAKGSPDRDAAWRQLNKLHFSSSDTQELFQHSAVTFEDDLDGFITTRPKDQTNSPPKVAELEQQMPVQQKLFSAVAEDLVRQKNAQNDVQQGAAHEGLDSNNNNDKEGHVSFATVTDTEADTSWSYETLPGVSVLTVDCQPPISTSTPKHSPQVHWKKAERRRPIVAITTFDLSDCNAMTTMEDSSLLNVTTRTPPSPLASATTAVAKRQEPVVMRQEAISKRQESPGAVTRNPVRTNLCANQPLSGRADRTRQRRQSLEDMFASPGKPPSQAVTPNIAKRNSRGLGGGAWKSTGDLNSSKSFTSELQSTPEKSPPKKANDAKFKAAEKIRLRAMEYSQQVRRREQAKQLGRDLGAPSAESRVRPILHRSPLGGASGGLMSTPSIIDMYASTFTRGGYPNVRVYPAYRPGSRRFDHV